MAGGHFYLGGGTAVQQATGHSDTADEMYKYLVAVSRKPDLAKIRAYCDGSVEHFNWLEDLGFEFERSYYPGKVVVPPGTEGLSYTGNEKVWPFCEQAVPRPRALGAGARRARRRGHGDRPGCLAGPAISGGSSATRPARPALVDEDGRHHGAAWKHFTETACGEGEFGDHRGRRFR
jgi:hypothetical protein